MSSNFVCHILSSIFASFDRCGSQVIALSVQVFVFAGQAAKDQCGWSEGGYDGYGPVNYQTLPICHPYTWYLRCDRTVAKFGDSWDSVGQMNLVGFSN